MLKTSARLLRRRSSSQIHMLFGHNLTKRLLMFAILVCTIPTFNMLCWASRVNDAKPRFEVATVKPNVSGCCTSSKWSVNQVVFSNQTLMHLIIFAYSLQPQQVVGPKWLETVRFDVTAKYSPGTQMKDRLMMLRTLLEDRFELTVHQDTKLMQAYELIVAPSGFKLKPVEPGEGSYSSGEQDGLRSFRARKISMYDLAYDLADSLGEPVINKTAQDGVYDFQLAWSGDDLSSSASNSQSAPPMFTALQDSLGLRLVHRKISVPVVVVDHVNRTPAEN